MFPIIQRSTLNELLNGYWFHPEFYYHAGDVWLGAYVSLMGEIGLECSESRIQNLPPQRQANWEHNVVDANTSTALVRNWHAGCRDYVAPEINHYSTKKYYKMNDNRPYWEPSWGKYPDNWGKIVE